MTGESKHVIIPDETTPAYLDLLANYDALPDELDEELIRTLTIHPVEENIPVVLPESKEQRSELPFEFHDDEQLWIIIGVRRDNFFVGMLHQETYNRGTPSSVDANWQWALRRQETVGDVIGFHHEHPSGLSKPSSRDTRTMSAWVDGEWIPLLCTISYGKYSDGTFHGIGGFVFSPGSDESYIVAELVIVGKYILGYYDTPKKKK